jgi:trimethylamine:corrinoid methyltransferase-like protein
MPDFSAARLTEAVDLIDAVGPHAEYVSLEHTLAHFRSFWYPGVFDRSNFDPRGGQTPDALADRLHARAQQIVSEHEPQALQPKLADELRAIEAAWRSRA